MLSAHARALSSFNSSVYAMASGIYCISDLDLDLDLSLGGLFGRCRKRRQISSEATNLISKLGDDLLVEILIRSFPSPRSACRCKAVCKRWSSLISSPCFNRRFVSHPQTMNLLHQPPMPPTPNELQSIILSFLPPIPDRARDNLIVMDCFKDLVLCGFLDLDCNNGELGRSYLVCNPFTKQWIALPLAPNKSEGYFGAVARLVFEPRISNNLDLGVDQAFVYSEYRFRVVCIYQYKTPVSLRLDVFCSESGEWIKEALVRDGHQRLGTKCVCSCNGELFWMYMELFEGGVPRSVAVFNAFRLDEPLTRIDLLEGSWLISVSQGALHVISCKQKTATLHSIVWRLEEDRKSWRKRCEGLVKNIKCCGYTPKDCIQPFLHPYNPEILFFQCIADEKALLSCDLRREKLEFFAKLEGGVADYIIKVFEPKVSCWPTPIPRYEKLRGIYDGSYSFWVQSSSEATTWSRTDGCQLVDGSPDARQHISIMPPGIVLRSRTHGKALSFY